RRRNLIPKERFPYTTPLGFVYDSGDYEGALDAVLALGRVAAARAEQTAARGEGRLVGVGIALYVERVGPGWESAAVTVEGGGRDSPGYRLGPLRARKTRVLSWRLSRLPRDRAYDRRGPHPAHRRR